MEVFTLENATQNTEKRKKFSPFSVVVLTILFFLISVGALFAAFYYNVFVAAVQQETVNTQKHELSSSVKYFDTLLSVTNTMSNRIATSHNILRFSETPKDYALYHIIINELLEHKNSLSTINSIWAVFENSDVVLTSNEGYFQIDEFYDFTWNEFDRFLPLPNESTVITQPRTITPRAMNRTEVISIIQKTRCGTGENAETAYIVINLDFKRVLSALRYDEWISESAANEIVIVDGNAQCIYDPGSYYLSIGGDRLQEVMQPDYDYSIMRLGTQKYICQSVSSNKTPWSFLRLTSTEENYLPRNWLMRVVQISLLACIVALVLFCVTVFRRILLPHRRMVRQLNSGGHQLIGNEMDYIEQSIARFASTQHLLTQTYLEHALLHPISESDYAQEPIVSLGDFLLFMISFERGDPSQSTIFARKTNLLNESVSAFFESQQPTLRFHNLHLVNLASSLVVIYEYAAEMPMELAESSAELLRQNLLVQKNFTCSIAVSDKNHGILQLHTAFLQARDATEPHYFFPSQKICVYSKSINYKRSFFSVNRVKAEVFTNNLRNKQYLNALETLDDIVADIYKALDKALLINLPNFFANLLDQVYRAALQLNQNPLNFFANVITLRSENGNVFDTWTFQTIDEPIRLLREMILMLEKEHQRMAISESSSDRSKAVSLAVAYIENNYASGLSLSEISEQLSIDETYLSKQFKEKMGCSFVQYTTRLRITKAKELLSNTQATQQEISECVGMGNAQNFIRTFKKYEGVTPGQFRKMSERSAQDDAGGES